MPLLRLGVDAGSRSPDQRGSPIVFAQPHLPRWLRGGCFPVEPRLRFVAEPNSRRPADQCWIARNEFQLSELPRRARLSLPGQAALPLYLPSFSVRMRIAQRCWPRCRKHVRQPAVDFRWRTRSPTVEQLAIPAASRPLRPVL